jgi:hypothetical protein
VRKGTCFFFCIRIRSSLCMPVTLAVPYLPTGLAGCSVDPGISRGARKLTRTPRVIKKKMEYIKLKINIESNIVLFPLTCYPNFTHILIWKLQGGLCVYDVVLCSKKILLYMVNWFIPAVLDLSLESLRKYESEEEHNSAIHPLLKGVVKSMY